MKYSEITFRDKNPIKRWLQQQRLVSALRAVKQLNCTPSVICDFGAGNGELCKLLSNRYPNTHIICYEPTLGLLNEAKENLKEISNISYIKNVGDLINDSVDLVFSLEVFEHLPHKETNSALQAIQATLKSNGRLIIGVPVEIGVPALYKGAFRMVRRYGAFDANVKNVFMSFIGNPPSNRPTREITPGFNYYFEHVGFDHRKLIEILKHYFINQSIESSPFPRIGAYLSCE
jgi:trans-aconitate methyltransferase